LAVCAKSIADDQDPFIIAGGSWGHNQSIVWSSSSDIKVKEESMLLTAFKHYDVYPGEHKHVIGTEVGSAEA
jgi:hypothetical protein